MNNTTSHILQCLVAAAILLVCASTMRGDVNLTVTPSAASSAYSGPIKLDITGLTVGEQVTVSEFLDLNGNSTVDSGDLMIDAFQITDGGAGTIGGVTNINVPFDSDPAGGAITTIPLGSPLSFENIVGRHIYQVTDPGHFTPQTATFSVTNAALAQAVSGTVFSGGAFVPGALVVALTPPNGDFAGAVIANNSGQYTFNLIPGSYLLFALASNSYIDQSTAPFVTLTNGNNANADLYVTNSAVTISGQVYNQANSNALGGVFVQLESESGNLNSFAFTGTNGTYTGAATPGNWEVIVQSSRLARRAFMASQNGLQVDASGGSVSDANVALYKANALFYGRVTDASSIGISGLHMYAQDDVDEFESEGFTDTNGSYTVAVLATNGFWSCSLSTEGPDLAGYVFSRGVSTNLSAGDTVLQNFGLSAATAQISGYIRDNLGNPVVGVSIGADAVIGGNLFDTAQVETDDQGYYAFGAASGIWSVHVNCCGDNGLESYGLYDLFNHSVTIPPTNTVVNITVFEIGTPLLSQPAHFGSSIFGFGLNGSSGSNYTIQVSTNLSSGWSTILVTNLPGNFIYFQDNEATNKQRFYRVKLGL
jgi:Protein of unknown function (DUF1416)